MYAPVWCKTFNGEAGSSYNYTDVNFKISFNGVDNYVRLPMYSLMRDGPADSNPKCNLLVFRSTVEGPYPDS